MAFRTLSLLVLATSAFLPTAGAAQTLRGSQASVDLMYARAQDRDLEFLRTPEEVQQAAASGTLELIAVTEDLALEKAAFPYVLPSTRRFTDSLAKEFRAACGERLVVTSGVRPLDEQPRNASPKSVHPTGMAVDFRKPRGACLKWLRKSLLALEGRRVIEATEERRPVHFHVAVLQQDRPQRVNAAASPARAGSAEPKPAPRDVAAPARGESTTAKAPSAPSTPSVYRVRPGDNLSTIARRYDTTPERLRELNGLRSSKILVGQRLKIR